MAEENEEKAVAIPTLWVGESETPVVFGNQFSIAHQGVDEFILTVGQVATPLVTGDEEDRLEQVKNLSYVPIRVVGRFTFTRKRLVELIGVLTTNLKRYDATIKEREG